MSCGGGAEPTDTQTTSSTTPTDTATVTLTITPTSTPAPIDTPTQTATETPTSLPTNTATESGSNALVYRLTEGSQYYFRSGSKPPEVSALSGTMQLVAREVTENNFQEYEVLGFDFERSNERMIVGHEGSVTVSGTLGHPVSMRLTLKVTGFDAELSGVDAFSGDPPRFRGIRIEGRSGPASIGRVFRLTILAEPEP